MAPQSIPQPKPLAAAEPRAGSGVIAAWRFRLAVLMHDRAVYRLAVALLRDAGEAEDVTQEVFLGSTASGSSDRASGCCAWRATRLLAGFASRVAC
jgi:hypothetical protein